MEKNKKKAAAPSKGKLLNILNKASKAGMEVNIKNAPVLMDKKQVKNEENDAIQKISMDLKIDTVSKIHKAMYWGRMDSRAAVVEDALFEYFKNHPELVKEVPPKK
jgi:hypothetical protein